MFSWPKIKRSDRVAIIGPSGSGKTVLAKALLRNRRNVLVVDTKAIEKWHSVGRVVSTKELTRIRGGRFVYTVPPSFLVTPAEQSAFFTALLHARNRAVYVDEIADMLPTHGLKILATQGRAANVGLWTGTQRPYSVPLYTITEAQHFFIFGLRLERDQARVEQAVGAKLPWAELRSKKHFFVYVNEAGEVSSPQKLRLA
jgi:energy-coupling factor transporter ATP-binding protein EcfA2